LGLLRFLLAGHLENMHATNKECNVLIATAAIFFEEGEGKAISKYDWVAPRNCFFFDITQL